MNNIKRFLTLFLALVMCFSLVPESVFAADKITGEEVKESVVEKETATSSEEKTIVEESEEKTLNGEEKSVEPNSEVSVNITSEDGTDMDVCEISAGETLQLIATVAPNNITWSSSDITVLTVNETGLSTAVAEGTATVTVTADNEGEISDSVLFAVVSNENAEVFEKEKSDVDIAIGESTEEKTAETEITKNTTEEGFSYYTVEFTYNKRQYVLEGDTEAALEEILEYLGISGEVETAISDAPDLFDVENGNVISKQAFNTEQKLTVKMTDGQIYEIVVTDNVYINKSSLSVRYPTDEEIAEYVQEYIDACGIKSITELDEENYESAQYWNGYLYSNSEVRAKNGKIPDAIKIIENNEEKTKYIQKNIDYKHESHNYLLEKTDNKEYASTLSTHKCSNDKSGHGYDTGDYSYRWYGVYGKDADGETVSTSGSSQCAGFASYMLYVIYHADKDDSHLFKTITSFSKYSPEPGDYIRDGTHSFVVYKVEGGKVHTIQCNANIANGIGTCMIYTKKYSSISDFKSILGAGDYVWRLKNKNPDIRETVQTYVKIRANREGNNIKDKPFEGDSCNVVRAMVYGETYIATKIVKNNKDNYWYYVPELKGYVSANAVEYVDHAEDKMITFEDTVITKKNPGTYDLPGRMTQPGNVTIKLTAEIIPSDSDKSVQSSTREFSGKINYLCSKKGGASSCGSLCNNLKFKELPNNTLYCYKLTAKYTLYHCKSNDDKADLIAETREEINESWFKFGKVSDTWSVTYNMNGQGKQISAQTVIKGKQAKKPSDPSAEGYIFEGWYTDKDCTKAYNFDNAVNENITLYAKWTPTITFNANYESETDTANVKTVKIEKGSKVAMPKDEFSRKGYYISAWTTNADGTGSSYKPNKQYELSESLTLYAQWKPITYTVQYDKNFFKLFGDTGSTANSTHTYDESKNLTANGFKREGYKFAGWSTDSSASTAKYTDKSPAINLTDKNNDVVTLYAVWKDGFVKYKIQLNANNPSGKITTKEVKQGEKLKLSDSTFSKTGYYISAWTTNADGTGTSYKPNGEFEPSKALTLYAQWKPITYTIQYDKNFWGWFSDTGSTANSTHTYDKNKNLSTNGFKREGFKFVGWSTDDDATTAQYTNGEAVKNLSSKNNGKITLYAIWKENVVTYKVQLNANNPSGKITTKEVKRGEKLKLSDSTFSKTGYYISAWTTNANGTGTSYGPNEKFEPTASLTLYAKWKPITYTVNYNKNYTNWFYINNPGSTDSSTHTYDKSKSLTKNGFKRSGYTFIGWSTKSSSTSATYSDSQSVINLSSTKGGKVTLYAVWKSDDPDKCIITYNTSGSGVTAPSAESADKGSKVKLKSPPARTGYTFSGWSTSESGDTVSSPYTVTKDITLYAIWKPNTYTVKFNSNGGKGSMDDVVFEYGLTYTLPLNKFSRSGKTFLGWSTSKDGIVEYSDGKKVPSLSSSNGGTVTLYAKWGTNTVEGSDVSSILKNAKETDTYIQFKAKENINMYNVPGISTTYSVSKKVGTIKKNEIVTATAIYKNTANHYWYYVKNSSDTQGFAYFDKLEVVGIPDTALSIKNGWSAKTITGGNKKTIPGVIEAQKGITITSVHSVVKDSTGKEYKSNHNGLSKTSYTLKDSKIDTETKFASLAKGKATYTLSAKVSAKKITGNTTLDDYNRGNAITLESRTFTVMGPYKISYDLNGGSGTKPGNQQVKYFENMIPSEYNGTKEGYTFKGWYLLRSDGKYYVDGDTWYSQYEVEQNGKTPRIYKSGNKYSIGGKATSGKASCSFTLVAVWNPKEYTITYNANGGWCNANGGWSPTTSQKKTHGDPIVLLSESPIRIGYRFDGWAASALDATLGEVAYYPSEEYYDNKSCTLYAVWTRVVDNIKLTVANPAEGSIFPNNVTVDSGCGYSVVNTSWIDSETGQEISGIVGHSKSYILTTTLRTDNRCIFNADGNLINVSVNGSSQKCFVADDNEIVIQREISTILDESKITITEQPESCETAVGGTAILEVTASYNGSGDLTYCWQDYNCYTKYWEPATDFAAAYTNPTFTVSDANLYLNDYQFRCVVTGPNGEEAISEPAAITVNEDYQIAIIEQTESCGTYVGGTATLEVVATYNGPGDLTYCWQDYNCYTRYWEPATDFATAYTNSTFTVSDANLYLNDYQFRCVVTGPNGEEAISEPATITVNEDYHITITEQPEFCETTAGGTATLRVTATYDGPGELTYCWQDYNCYTQYWEPATDFATSYTNPTFTVSDANLYLNDYQFRCVITGPNGEEAVTETASIAVNEDYKIEIIGQPISCTATIGMSISMHVGAEYNGPNGPGDLTYCWQVYNANTKYWEPAVYFGTEYTEKDFNIRISLNDYQLRCVITGPNGEKAISDTATITVKGDYQITITEQPESCETYIGGTASLEVAATYNGTGKMTYCWQSYNSDTEDWEPAADFSTSYTAPTFTVSNANLSLNDYQFRCVITGPNGEEAISETAEITVNEEYRIEITEQPVSCVTYAGRTATLEVIATYIGIGNLTYCWQSYNCDAEDWEPAADFSTAYTNPTFTVSDVNQDINDYQFRCVITGPNGEEAISEIATITVNEGCQITITEQPKSCEIYDRELVTLTVNATYDDSDDLGRLTYCWQKYNCSTRCWETAMESGNENRFNTYLYRDNYYYSEGYQFRCVITGPKGEEVISETATITVKGNYKISITEQPKSCETYVGGTATLKVTADNVSGSINYCWQCYNSSTKSWELPTDFAAEYTRSTFTVSNADLSLNDYQFRCVITVTGDDVRNRIIGDIAISETAKITVKEDYQITITEQPKSCETYVGGKATLEVAATYNGSGNLTYCWQSYNCDTEKWEPAADFSTSYTNSTFTVSNVNQDLNNCRFRCVITGPNGEEAISDASTITIGAELIGRLRFEFDAYMLTDNDFPHYVLYVDTCSQSCYIDSIVWHDSNGNEIDTPFGQNTITANITLNASDGYVFRDETGNTVRAEIIYNPSGLIDEYTETYNTNRSITYSYTVPALRNLVISLSGNTEYINSISCRSSQLGKWYYDYNIPSTNIYVMPDSRFDCFVQTAYGNDAIGSTDDYNLSANLTLVETYLKSTDTEDTMLISAHYLSSAYPENNGSISVGQAISSLGLSDTTLFNRLGVTNIAGSVASAGINESYAVTEDTKLYLSGIESGFIFGKETNGNWWLITPEGALYFINTILSGTNCYSETSRPSFYKYADLIKVVYAVNPSGSSFEMDPYMFADLRNLETAIIDACCTSIGENAFVNDEKLCAVGYLGTDEMWINLPISSGNDCLVKVKPQSITDPNETPPLTTFSNPMCDNSGNTEDADTSDNEIEEKIPEEDSEYQNPGDEISENTNSKDKKDTITDNAVDDAAAVYDDPDIVGGLEFIEPAV